MRAVVQRVSEASVTVEDRVVGSIGCGLVVLLGVGRDDSEEQANALARKIANLRIFTDEAGKFNLSAPEVGAEVLVVSQFTLYADARKGRRPSFIEAAAPEKARALVDCFADRIRELGLPVASGVFQAHMLVKIFNDGPVTIVLDTEIL
ncbi:MAG: D-aminoacyl-tRNA deacylase [Chloroflexi bacterium]|nr:D-aminoacyl-tRNA deacylase [Chloroflexota bacterium]